MKVVIQRVRWALVAVEQKRNCLHEKRAFVIFGNRKKDIKNYIGNASP